MRAIDRVEHLGEPVSVNGEKRLPNRWEVVELNALCDLQNGYAFQSKDYVEASNTLNCRMSNIRPDGIFDLDYNPKFLPDSYAEKYSQYLLKDGDVIIAMTDMATEPKILGVPTVVFTNRKNVLLNQRVGKLVIKEPKLLHFPYLKYALSRKQVRTHYLRFAGGGVQINLGKNDLLSVKIPLPPLEEQCRIAAILDKADAVRRKRKEAIALTEELLRSAFLEMFGNPVTNPKGWDVVPLGDISKVKGGLQVTPKRKDNPIEVPYLRVANVYRDQLVLDEVKLIRVTPEELERTALCTGDLLIVEGHGNSQEIGRSSVWDGSIPNCTHQNHLIRVILDSKRAEPTYISAFLNSSGGRRQLIQFGKTTSGLNTISTSNVKATKVLLPPLSEQKKYANLKQKTAVCLGDHQKHFQNTNNLFNSLLQRAFRGEL